MFSVARIGRVLSNDHQTDNSFSISGVPRVFVICFHCSVVTVFLISLLKNLFFGLQGASRFCDCFCSDCHKLFSRVDNC